MNESRRLKIGVVMDPIEKITIQKDTTFALLLAAQEKQWPIYYMTPTDLFVRDQQVFGQVKQLRVVDDPTNWFHVLSEETMPLPELDVILMRKDPPFDIEYIYTTYLLELAEKAGVFVVNKPQSLRDANEKVFTTHFPGCTPPTLVTRQYILLRQFLDEHQDVIFKPLAGMGGASVFRVQQSDPNIAVIMETLTAYQTRFIMAQRFIPEITAGDKRILMIGGKPFPHALARLPLPGETRANLAAGGTGVSVPLTARDKEICAQVGPVLQEKGLLFVGLDVIGDYLTEINVTSPTCLRELEKIHHHSIAMDVMDCILAHVLQHKRR